MHNTNEKGKHALKQGLILFLCALICAASLFGIWKILNRGKTTQDNIVTPSDALETIVPEETPEAEEIEPGAQPTQDVATPAEPEETPMPTQEAAVMANPLDERATAAPAAVMPDMSDEEEESVQLPLTGLRIGIDPGHQAHGNSAQEPVAPGSSETKAKVSSGTQGVASGVAEYVTNLEVSLKLRDVLESLGAQVVMTRTEHDVDISNVERAQLCNEAQVDVVLRIHCNGSTNSQAQGIGLYVTATGDIAQESAAIAEVILNAMVEETGAEKDGVFKRDTYSGLNWSEVPAMIVEMGFMSNPEEDMKLQDEEYQQKLVDGMVKGIAQYFGRELMQE